MSDMDLDGLMERRIGPLPTGVWLLAVGGGIAVAVIVRRRAATGSDTPAEPVASTDTPTGAGNLGANDGTDPNTPTGPQRPTTNDEWYSVAVSLILGTHAGYVPTTVETALRRYLDGQTLNASDRAIVDMAIRLAGPPPQAPPAPDPGTEPGTPTPPKPKPPKPPTKPKPTQHFTTYTVRKGDTLSGIAKKHHVTLSTLKKYNKGLFDKKHHNGNLIRPGEHVKIPVGGTVHTMETAEAPEQEAAAVTVTGNVTQGHPVRHDVMPQQRAFHPEH